jgi:translation initiation factor IF-2
MSIKITTKERAPVVVIMGHVDHGKSTLLDYIRKTNIVDGEAGGITQHLSAYEVNHKTSDGKERAITFIDTPGHAAFSGMRSRGAQVADIAILIVSAEDGVKMQTIEAIKTIKENDVPFIVGINKIDRPGANIDKTKMDLAENEVYLEGMGGTTPFVLISAKTGEGVPELFETISLVADLEEFVGTPEIPANGLIIESKSDSKIGAQATLIIKNGTVKKGQFIVAGNTYASTKMLEDFLGKPTQSASFSNAIRVSGWSNVPKVGTRFTTVDTKKEAEEIILEWQDETTSPDTIDADKKYIPLIIKTDVLGTAEAIEKEVKKLSQEKIAYRIMTCGVGNISEGDIRRAASDKDTVIVGFNVKVDPVARDTNEKIGLTIELFNIIYKLTEWLEINLEAKRPRVETIESIGQLKIIKTFSQTRDKQVVGGKVINGRIESGSIVRIIRRENEIGRGKILEVQKSKAKTKDAIEGEECGLFVEAKLDIAAGDILESFIIVQK